MQQVLNGIAYRQIGTGNPDITALACDTADVVPGCLFFCLSGSKNDGHDFFRKAIGDGAAAVVCERPLDTQAVQFVVEDSRAAMSLAARNFYGRAADKLKLVTETSAKLKSDLSGLKNARYIDRNSLYKFYSSKGADITYDFQTTGEAYSMAFTHNNETLQEQLSHAKTDFAELGYTDKQLADFVAECENYIKNAKAIVPGSYPVVFAPQVTGVFAHESFGHKSESDFMLGDETMAKEWQIGKRVASPLLTIRESGVHPGSGYVPYDDEGTAATDTYLINKGVLSGRLHSATTAAALDEQLTGNARAINCDYEPIVRMTTTYVDNGDSTPEQLIADVGHGYYIKSYKHGSGMSTFTIAPSIAYEIVDGKIGDPVKIAVLTGNVFETLGLIDGVANDLTLLSFVTGGCGKLEQFPLNVGLGGPHIRISKMNVQ